ncbi:GAF domain-containing protein [Nitrogeniibacter mangrovi]|uniref:GAF domain-containing protein n=1 Tax=Nitrogeniibacter mangrovi TaxID=2016596 RepID=A0A6C1B0R1_9RHOO|nr:pyridoxamine 5'-phosphate oxidase family protein [Nitrogeniibacter mangrovi]QID16485.1 GAF domain-containing protein [Nitrogeniibacter mangrovi]
MTRLSMDALRNCLEGIVPSAIATCAPDGTPNVTYISQLMHVDDAHVALSFQFFNKTRENILANPIATVLMMDPDTGARYRLRIRYLRTETAGALFERMKAKLAGIASHTGMAGVFRLRGADIYRVLDIEAVPGRTLPPPDTGPILLPALRRSVDALSACTTLEALMDTLQLCLERHFGIEHQMLLMADGTAERLYVVASRGYASSGAGAEIAYGDGVIGVAAREGTPIRIMFPAAEYAYGRAVRERIADAGGDTPLAAEIPLPGLAAPASQLAVPIRTEGRTVAVLYVESEQLCHFGYDLEDALVTLGAQLALSMRALHADAADDVVAVPETAPDVPRGVPLRVRHFARDDSVFFDDDYLIKGVAGAILRRLLQEHARSGRCDFSNRELRLDDGLRLPDICDNLDTRLILLARRLADRSADVRIEKTGRGRFRLQLKRPVVLEET